MAFVYFDIVIATLIDFQKAKKNIRHMACLFIPFSSFISFSPDHSIPPMKTITFCSPTYRVILILIWLF